MVLNVLKKLTAINAFALILSAGLMLCHQNNMLFQESQWTWTPPPIPMTINRPIAHQKRTSQRLLNSSLPCNLYPNPVPMILMSLGRSGTASTYQVISALSGGEISRIYEYTGGSTEKSRHFFRNMVNKTDMNGDWLIKFLCHEQTRYPKAGVVAFKWKPYETLFEEEKALQGLSLLGRLQEVQVKVLRSKRNLLDVMISR